MRPIVSKGGVLVSVLLAGFLARSASHAAPAPTPAWMTVYLTPQKLVPVGHGRSINLVCLGHGAPTVILTAGLGDWSAMWGLVQPALAQRTGVCAWDRAGYGFSSPSSAPQDIVDTTADLERALKGAGVRGPYVMVGHSLGAYESLRFTDLNRQSVVGMVLVDPAIPNQIALEGRFAPLLKLKGHALDERRVRQLEQCASELRGAMLKRGTSKFEQCTAAPAVPARFPRLRAAMARLNANPARLLTQASTVKEFDSDPSPDSREALNPHRHYGDMPLTVLTAGRDEAVVLQEFRTDPPTERARLRKQVGRFLRNAWVPAHGTYARLSSRGRNELVPDSGHMIQVDKPQVVISAVVEVLCEIHAGAQQEP
jgi:pimeloyl-ACP methyl ester carboxylesterase